MQDLTENHRHLDRPVAATQVQQKGNSGQRKASITSPRNWIFLLVLILALSACGARQFAGQGSPDAAAAASASPTATTTKRVTSPPTLTNSPTQTPVPTSTPSPAPTATPTATRTSTSTPTPTPTPLHPLSIEYMRQQTYPGSEITIERTLAPGGNYNRYIAAYRSDGLRIHALLTVPRGPKPEGGWPVIVFNHGYIPPAQYRTTERYVAYVDGFARNGYIVLRPDYRGHGRSEGDPASNYASPDYTIDVLNAVAAIQRFPDANPDQIGMWGHSMGGGITLRVMVTTSGVKAGVIWAGTVADYGELFERRWGLDGSGDNPLPTLEPNSHRWSWVPEMLETYGTPQENPDFYASISPNSYLRDLSGPVQLHHGTADSSVPVAYSEMLESQIQAVGGQVELFTYTGDNHNISANFSRAMARSVRFFDIYVKRTKDEWWGSRIWVGRTQGGSAPTDCGR